jgi:hypothetical protein
MGTYVRPPPGIYDDEDDEDGSEDDDDDDDGDLLAEALPNPAGAGEMPREPRVGLAARRQTEPQTEVAVARRRPAASQASEASPRAPVASKAGKKKTTPQANAKRKQ